MYIYIYVCMYIYIYIYIYYVVNLPAASFWGASKTYATSSGAWMLKISRNNILIESLWTNVCMCVCVCMYVCMYVYMNY